MGRLRYLGVLPDKAPKDVIVLMRHYSQRMCELGLILHTHEVRKKEKWSAIPIEMVDYSFPEMEHCSLVLYWHNIWSMRPPEGRVLIALAAGKAYQIPTFNIGSPTDLISLEEYLDVLARVPGDVQGMART